MKVLQILPELNVGGVETGTVDFAKYLVEHGHDSIVVSNGGGLVEELIGSGSRHYTLPVHRKSLFSMIRLIRPLRRIIIKEKVDIVHARSRVPAWVAFFACRHTQASFITTCHGYYHNKFFSQVMGWAKLVIVPSEAIGRHMIDTYGVDSSRIRRIPRSVDLTKFHVRRDEIKGRSYQVIGILGRLTPLKGHKFFLRSMAKVVRLMPYTKIWIIGDAPANKEAYRHDLEMEVDRLGIREYVEFLGNRRDIPDLLAQMNVLVFASTVPESFGRVILEAQAVGVPVVATKVGGVVDIIEDGKTGLLVTPKDTQAMANEVVRLMRDTQLAESLALEAEKKLHREFTIDQMSSKTLQVYEELLSTMNILVIKISSIGDVILISASLKALRKKFPKARITCLVGKDEQKVLQSCPYIDEIIAYDYKGRDRGWLGLWRLANRLRKYHFDKIVDFQNNKKSHLLSFLCLPRESYGYDNGKWGFLLTDTVKGGQKEISPVAHQFQVLNLLGIRMPDNVRLEMWPRKKETVYAEELLESEWLANSKRMVGINIAASEKWPTKSWPVEHIAKLCDILAEKNIRVFITGMPKDILLAKRVGELTKSKPTLFIGKTDIVQLAALIKRCQVYITPDSAPLHVAASIDTPVIALFGPTSSKRHAPPAQNIAIFEKQLHCAPCYSSRCKILTHACMQEILPEDIAEKVEEMMEARQ